MEHIEKMRYWCHKIMPLVYDDSLSYYEVLCKITKKLNEVIDTSNEIQDIVKEEARAYIRSDSFKEYVESLVNAYANINDNNFPVYDGKRVYKLCNPTGKNSVQYGEDDYKSMYSELCSATKVSDSSSLFIMKTNPVDTHGEVKVQVRDKNSNGIRNERVLTQMGDANSVCYGFDDYVYINHLGYRISSGVLRYDCKISKYNYVEGSVQTKTFSTLSSINCIGYDNTDQTIIAYCKPDNSIYKIDYYLESVELVCTLSNDYTKFEIIDISIVGDILYMLVNPNFIIAYDIRNNIGKWINIPTVIDSQWKTGKPVSISVSEDGTMDIFTCEHMGYEVLSNLTLTQWFEGNCKTNVRKYRTIGDHEPQNIEDIMSHGNYTLELHCNGTTSYKNPNGSPTNQFKYIQEAIEYAATINCNDFNIVVESRDRTYTCIGTNKNIRIMPSDDATDIITVGGFYIRGSGTVYIRGLRIVCATDNDSYKGGCIYSADCSRLTLSKCYLMPEWTIEEKLYRANSGVSLHHSNLSYILPSQSDYPSGTSASNIITNESEFWGKFAVPYVTSDGTNIIDTGVHVFKYGGTLAGDTTTEGEHRYNFTNFGKSVMPEGVMFKFRFKDDSGNVYETGLVSLTETNHYTVLVSRSRVRRCAVETLDIGVILRLFDDEITLDNLYDPEIQVNM